MSGFSGDGVFESSAPARAADRLGLGADRRGAGPALRAADADRMGPGDSACADNALAARLMGIRPVRVA